MNSRVIRMNLAEEDDGRWQKNNIGCPKGIEQFLNTLETDAPTDSETWGGPKDVINEPFQDDSRDYANAT